MINVLNRNRRKAAIFLLFLFVMFSIMSYQQEAQALAPVVAAVAVVGAAAALYCLIAAGVEFVSSGAAQEAGEGFYQMYKDRWDQCAMAGKLIYNAAEDAYKWVCNIGEEFWADIKAYVDANYDVGENTYQITTPLPTDQTHYQMTIDGVPQFTVCVDYDTTNPNSWKRYFYIEDGVFHHELYINGILDSHDTRVLDREADVIYYRYTSSTFAWIWEDTGGTVYTIGVGVLGANSFVYTLGNVISTGVVGKEGYVDNPTYDWDSPWTGEKDIGIDVYPELNPDAGDILVNDQVGVSIPDTVLDDVVGMSVDDVIAADITGVEVIGEDAAANPTEGVDDYTAGQDLVIDETQTSLSGLLFSKFPFCLPWDIAQAIKLIAAPAEAPYIKVDLLSPLGSEWVGKGVIEMDMKEYPIVGQVCRWASTVEFCILLILATRKLIWS